MQLWVCEIIEGVQNLTVLVGLKNPTFPFFISIFFCSFSKNSQVTPLNFPQYESAIWDRKPILVNNKQCVNHIM